MKRTEIFNEADPQAQLWTPWKQPRVPSDTEFGVICEVFRLLELRGGYTSLIVDVESELAFLRHITGSNLCARANYNLHSR